MTDRTAVRTEQNRNDKLPHPLAAVLKVVQRCHHYCPSSSLLPLYTVLYDTMLRPSFAALCSTLLVTIAFAAPAHEEQKRQLSLPGSLIPKLGNLTDPLATNAPPLPILQLPTPPIDAAPFKASNTKPKKLGYFWTGAEDRKHRDFLAAVSLDDDTFGELIDVAEVPTSGNEPHHLGASADGKTLVGGGLLSLLKTQDTAFYFDVSNPYRPEFKKSNRAALASITDEIRAKPDGGFFITYMGSAAGELMSIVCVCPTTCR